MDFADDSCTVLSSADCEGSPRILEAGGRISSEDLFLKTSTEETTLRPYSISELTAQVKGLLEESLPACWVEGEISQYTHHGSGHRYFTLKDSSAQLSAVMFKWQASQLSFEPEQGMLALVYGHISVYERGGKYQFYATQIKPSGVGELALAFEQLKIRLEAEGLFDANRKRPLPPYPKKVGVVTSPTGAAIRDIIQVLGRRAPGLQVVLCPARVQGEGAAPEIAKAIADCGLSIVFARIATEHGVANDIFHIEASDSEEAFAPSRYLELRERLGQDLSAGKYHMEV